jgi:4-phytase/acid phosphatase/peptide/nickel transport system substrate-binding protein
MGSFLKNILHSGSSLNYMKYSNPKMDELLDRQNTSLDPVVRKKALCGVAKLVNEDAIFFYGGGIRFHIIAKTALQGISGAEHGIVKVSDVWVKGKK